MKINYILKWLKGYYHQYMRRLDFTPVRNARILLTGTLLLFLIASCQKSEHQDYYSTLGLVHVSGDSTIITSDEGERLLVSNARSLSTTLNDSDRVIANFTLVNKTLPAGINYVIDIYAVEKVLYKPVIELTDNISDSIGNDEVGINSIQLVKDFFNLSFVFYGNSKVHYINLVRKPGPIRTDTINLEIRHNNNTDNGMYSTYAFVSFDLKSLRNTVADSVILHVKAKEFNNRTFEKNFTYKY